MIRSVRVLVAVGVCVAAGGCAPPLSDDPPAPRRDGAVPEQTTTARIGGRAMNLAVRDRLLGALRIAAMELILAEQNPGALTTHDLVGALGRSAPDVRFVALTGAQARPLAGNSGKAPRFGAGLSPLPDVVYVHLAWEGAQPRMVLAGRSHTGATYAITQNGARIAQSWK